MESTAACPNAEAAAAAVSIGEAAAEGLDKPYSCCGEVALKGWFLRGLSWRGRAMPSEGTGTVADWERVLMWTAKDSMLARMLAGKVSDSPSRPRASTAPTQSVVASPGKTCEYRIHCLTRLVFAALALALALALGDALWEPWELWGPNCDIIGTDSEVDVLARH